MCYNSGDLQYFKIQTKFPKRLQKCVISSHPCVSSSKTCFQRLATDSLKRTGFCLILRGLPPDPGIDGRVCTACNFGLRGGSGTSSSRTSSSRAGSRDLEEVDGNDNAGLITGAWADISGTEGSRDPWGVDGSNNADLRSGTFRIPKPSLWVSLPRSLHVADGCLDGCTAALYCSLHVVVIAVNIQPWGWVALCSATCLLLMVCGCFLTMLGLRIAWRPLLVDLMIFLLWTVLTCC